MLRKSFFTLFAVLCAALAGFGQGTTGPAPKSTETVTKKPPVFRATKAQITEVQTMLKDKKLFTGEATGTLTDPTRNAIKSFQKDNGLKETGTLNRATLEKMGIELTETQKAIPVSDASFASSETKETKATTASKESTETKTSTASGVKRPAPFRANVEQIKAAQKLLRDGKMLTGGEDGKLDDTTRDGLGKYQDANGLKVTKTLNAITLEKMGITLTDAQKANVAAQAAYEAAKKN